MLSRTKAACCPVLIFLFFLVPTEVPAAGPATHILMTERAVEKVRDPELKALLSENLEALVSGSLYPDFGRALGFLPFQGRKTDFGFAAHHPVFIDAYLSHVSGKCSPPFTGCPELVAHMMGCAAHGMEDQVFRELFKNRASPAGGGKSNPDSHDLDTSVDMIVLSEHERLNAAPKHYLPGDDLVKIYRDMGLEVEIRNIEAGMRMHQRAYRAEAALASSFYGNDQQRVSLTPDEVYGLPGGIEHAAGVAARYWEVLWGRLNGGGLWDGIVVATWPEDGATGYPADHSSPDGGVAVFFSRAMLPKSFNENAFLLRDDQGSPVKGNFTKSDYGSMIAFRPLEDLKPGAAYTATITTAVKDLEGNLMPESFSWTFNTCCKVEPEKD